MIYLDNIDNQIKNEILETLKEIYTIYPKLENLISLVSDSNYLVNYIAQNFKKSNSLESLRASCNNDNTLFTTTAQYKPEKINKTYYNTGESALDFLLKTKPDFIGIGVKSNCSYDVSISRIEKGYNLGWSYSRNIRDAVYHELGHIFSIIFKLPYIEDIRELLEESIYDESLSGYAKTNMEEMIAEAFSMYSYNPYYSELVYIVGTSINSLYQIYHKTELFDVPTKSLIKK